MVIAGGIFGLGALATAAITFVILTDVDRVCLWVEPIGDRRREPCRVPLDRERWHVRLHAGPDVAW